MGAADVVLHPAGSGAREALEAAGRGLLAWEMHRRAGIDVEARTPATVDDVATLHPRTGIAGLLRMHARCRVVEVTEEPGRAFGFTYDTLPGHPERGSQSFLVRVDPADGAVHGVIRTISRPASVLAVLGAPVALVEQRRIHRRYLAALRDLAGAPPILDRQRNRRPAGGEETS